MILLDASVIIEFIEDRPRSGAIVARLRDYRPDQVHIAAVTVFEVEHGLWPKSRNIRARRALWRDFYRGGIVPELLYDVIAERAAEVMHQTAARGRQLGKFDALVAATALHAELVLATMDRDFERVPGLQLEIWP